ncbi:MAG: hypothetical protein MRJ92_13515 [Nitrospira sp.]|nr:hypothetical protein [Nitrospira sp.]
MRHDESVNRPGFTRQSLHSGEQILPRLRMPPPIHPANNTSRSQVCSSANIAAACRIFADEAPEVVLQRIQQVRYDSKVPVDALAHVNLRPLVPPRAAENLGRYHTREHRLRHRELYLVRWRERMACEA